MEVAHGKNRERTGRFSRRLRVWAGVGGGTMGAVALLVLLAPVSSAVTVVSFTAPYTSFAATTYNAAYSTGCASGHSVGAPTWSNATGTFNAVERATMTGCTGYNYADIYAYTYLTGPAFTPSRGGNAYVVSTFTAGWQAHVSLAGTTTSGYNTSYAYASATVYSYLEDTTTGGIVGGTYSTFSATIVSLAMTNAGSATSTSTSSSFSIWAYGTVHGTHSYEFIVEIYTYAYLYSDTGASGSASLNLGGANGITMTGLTVY